MREEQGLWVYEVSEYIRFLNESFAAIVDPARVAVEGEVSSFGVSQGKYVRFDLKDRDGLMNCFLMLFNLRVDLEDGMRIRVYGVPRIYQKYGKLSISVSRIELVGEGALRRAYELMKRRLEEEGLFAPERKRPIPRFPEHIGLIASRESAACGDFLRILGNRWGGVRVSLAHVQVQGEPAVRQIVSAFRAMNALADLPQAIVLTRGGGSLEELGAFNSEEVARAIYSSRAPVVCGVGHERDESIADFVADLRASTPSNAAELVVPDRREIGYAVGSLAERIETAMDSGISDKRAGLARSAGRLEAYVMGEMHRVERTVARFRGAFREFAATAASRRRELARVSVSLESAADRWLGSLGDRLASAERLLATLDPKAVLRRGYAIVTGPSGAVVRDAAAVRAGDRIGITLHKGSVEAEVLREGEDQAALPI